MTEIFRAILLGVIQGVTEFLPVSSTGHLILAEKLLGISQETYGLTFDAALHLGTLLAIVWYFRKEWLQLFRSIIRTNEHNRDDIKQRKLLLLLVIGTVPAVVVGLLLEDVINSVFRSPMLVGATLILFSLVLIYVEKMGKKDKKIGGLVNIDAFAVGIAQSIALIPGVSRSGITIAAGMFRGLTRAEAARFAFLLSAPIVMGAGGKKFIETLSLFTQGALGGQEMMFFAVGIISAAVFGYLTIKYFLRYLSNRSLYPFVVYRVGLGFIILIISFVFR